jgi:hypothetical protein
VHAANLSDGAKNFEVNPAGNRRTTSEINDKVINIQYKDHTQRERGRERERERREGCITHK